MTSQCSAVALLLLATPVAAGPRDDARPLFNTAVTTFHSGDVRGARTAIARAVATDASWPLALAMQGRIAIATRDGAFAEARLHAAWQKGYPHRNLRHLFAHAFLLQGRADAALAEASFADIPVRYAAYAARMRAAAHVALGQRDAANRDLAAAARLAPNDSFVWSDIARWRLAGGDTGGALDAVDRALALQPANAEALVLSGVLLRARYGLTAALAWFDRALEIEPGNLAAMLERAATLGDLGRTRDMLAATRAVLAASPGNPQALYLQALMAARSGDWATARSVLYRVGDRLGDLPGARLLLASIELAGGNAEQAITQLKLLFAAQPDNVKVRRLYGSALWQSGDDRGAVLILTPLANRGDADSYTLSVIGRAHERMGDRVRAAAYLDRAAAPRRGPSTPLTGGSGAAREIRAQLSAGRSGAAVATAQSLQRANPGAPAFALMTGDAFSAQGNWQGATEAYRRAANLDFREAVALRLIGALRRVGAGEEAGAVLDLYRAQNPQNVAATRLAADRALASRQWSKAAALLEVLRQRLGNRDAVLLSNLGWAKLNLGQSEQAAKLGRAAYALAPHNPAIVASFGWFFAKAGDRGRAIAHLEKAVALAPAEPNYAAKLAELRRQR